MFNFFLKYVKSTSISLEAYAPNPITNPDSTSEATDVLNVIRRQFST